MSLFDFHEKYLNSLSGKAQRRSLSLSNGINFSSNDYLALANSDDLKLAAIAAIQSGIAIGAGGSRLLSGNHPEHIALEQQANMFFGSQSTLFFANGYAANMAVISTLPQPDDIIFYDEYIHASSHDGMRLARCPAISFRHNDVDDLEQKIHTWRSDGMRGQIWILCETLYSMDGDLAPIEELETLAERYDAIMIIDEAHATGVIGSMGKGLASYLDGRDNIIILRTCGKALGCEGALLSLPEIARDFLINRARHFIFSTAPSPVMAAVASSALGILQNRPEHVNRLAALSEYAGTKLSPMGAVSNGTPIIPIIIGDAKRTMELATILQQHGFDVRGIRPPTVPHGTSRLRICISLNINENDIDNLSKILGAHL